MKNSFFSVTGLILAFVLAFGNAPVAAAIVQPSETTQPSGSSLTDFQSKTTSAQNLVDSKNAMMTLAASSSTPDPAPAPYQDAEWTTPSDLRQVDKRNSQNQLEKRSYFKPDNTLYSVTTYNVYTGNASQIDWYHPGGKLVNIRQAYDSRGRLTRQAQYNTDYTLNYVNYYNASTGVKYSTERYYARGTVKTRELFDSLGVHFKTNGYTDQEKLDYETYIDVNTGNATKTDYFNSNGTLRQNDTFVDGSVSKSVYYDAAGAVLKEDRYSYSTVNGRPFVEKNTFNASGQKTATDLSLDAKVYSSTALDPSTGKITEEKWYASGGAYVTRKMTYDASGSPLKLEEFDSSGAVTKTVQAAALESAQGMKNWFSQNQAQNPTGLVTSYPSDSSVANQGFTYDQAVAGMAMLESGDLFGATKIFNFFNSNWQNNGFWTVYNTQLAAGSKVETIKINGPNAWIGQFALKFAQKTGDARGVTLATNVGKWIRALPQKDGAFAMGNVDMWANLYSVENNLSDYAFFKALSEKTTDATDRAAFAATASGLQAWLRDKAYDSARGIFRRGGSSSGGSAMTWDANYALDTNSWAVSALGVQGFKSLMNFDDNQLDAFVGRIASNFAVQDSGAFGGSVLTAKGFDFSDGTNAAQIGRPGIKWVEGTNQMIQVYKALGAYYAGTSASRSSYYSSLARQFAARNADNAVLSGNQLSYLYADRPGVRVFSDIETWSTGTGSGAASTAWVYFASTGLNPFSV